MTLSKYKLGDEFPREAFVQHTIEQYFQSQGYRLIESKHADLVCVHADTKECWIVEAKGETSAIGLDLNTGLGQLLRRMGEPSAKYAMAIPFSKKFLAQCRQIPGRVRDALNLHWIFVFPDGTVRVVGPKDRLPSADV